ncbi:hypothetical protein J6590_094979 [Homalodisca vitripennis]|nr:hypothetical protein J6590_094979 [Homalodisca vitripennis]
MSSPAQSVKPIRALLYNTVPSSRSHFTRAALIVSGLSTTREESVRDLVKDVGADIAVHVQDSDVAIAHQVPSYGLNRDPALIIQFADRESRAEWLNAYRKKRSLVAREVNQRFPAQRVYIGDHLSPENKKFLTSLKKKCREI